MSFKQIVKLGLTALIVLCWVLPLQASEHGAAHPPAEHGAEAAKAHPAAGNEHGSKAKHSAEGEGHGATGGHHAEPPDVYYLNWTLLAVTFLIVCSYCLWVHKRGKPKHEGLALSFLLVLVVILMYTLDQFPEVLRHFDAASRQFVDGYHEAPGLGFIKFIYKMGLGILLTIYGIIGREAH